MITLLLLALGLMAVVLLVAFWADRHHPPGPPPSEPHGKACTKWKQGL